MDSKSTKMQRLAMGDGGKGFMFYCPGCQLYHFVQISKGPRYKDAPVWEWNGDLEYPTFSPSLGVNMGMENQCHLFVRNGKIEYLLDCFHDLRGQTVEMQKESP